jgi:hypothetical protein
MNWKRCHENGIVQVWRTRANATSIDKKRKRTIIQTYHRTD